MAEAKMTDGYESDDSVIEVTPLDLYLSNELLRKEETEKKSEDEEIYILHMWNLPKDCTPDMIVKFFASFEKTKSVKVFLGAAGVIIQNLSCFTFAFVLFQSFDALNLGLLKNCQTMGERIIFVQVTTLFEAMIIGCHLRRRSDAMDHYDKYILLRNLPITATREEIVKFLSPYDIWLVNEKGQNTITISVANSSTVEKLYRLESELAAFFVYMNKNWSNFISGGIEKRIQICLVSCCSSLETETFPLERTHLPRPLHLENIVRRRPCTQNSSALATLKNLPHDVTSAEIASIFRERVLVSQKNISIVPTTSTSISASIFFGSREEGEFAVDNIKHFILRDHDVTVNLTCFTDA